MASAQECRDGQHFGASYHPLASPSVNSYLKHAVTFRELSAL
jgi:hypothetical protein